MDKPVVIVGGGLAALVAALLTRRAGFRGQIYIIERSQEVGGLLRAFDRGPFGRFDQGMHTFTTSIIPELNQLIEEQLPPDEWIYLQGSARDISGLVFEGKLQHACHYPDLRALPPPLLQECIEDFSSTLQAPTASVTPSNMAEYGRLRFGRVITEAVIEPTLQKLYGRSAKEIDPVVGKLLPLDRIALYDEPEFARLLPDDRVRARVAYPEQRHLPLKYSSGHHSIYPKKFGAHRLIDALVGRLRASNVVFLTQTELLEMRRSAGRVTELVLRDPTRTFTLGEVGQVYWTAGMLPLARILGLPAGASAFEAPKAFACMNLLLDRRPEVGDLYYFWCFDPRFAGFRITNFFNYCPEAVRAGGWPICFEFFLDPEQPRDETALIRLAERELRAYGVWPEGAKILCAAGHTLPVGFPILSQKNRHVLETAIGEVAAAAVTNLAVTGIQAKWGVVFQPDVLVHTWQTVRAKFS